MKNNDEYFEISVRQIFKAESPQEALVQMVDWLLDEGWEIVAEMATGLRPVDYGTATSPVIIAQASAPRFHVFREQ